MGKLIGFLLFFGLIIYIFLLGMRTLRMFLGSIFGTPPTQPRNTSNQQKNRQPTPPPTKKIITRDEGEYVDFEEIKE
jgi:hypothetical protein